MSSPAASAIDPVYTSGGPYSRELFKPGIDRRMVEFAAATGHGLDTVRIRGIVWCKENPRGGEFDQTLPEGFADQIVAAGDDEAAIRAARRAAIKTHGVDVYLDGSDAIVLKGVSLENAFQPGEDLEPIIAELVENGEAAAAHPDGGLVYVVQPAAAAASLWLAPRRPDGKRPNAKLEALRVSKDLMDAERNRPFGRPASHDGRLPASMRRLDVQGGIAIIGQVGHQEVFRSPALTLDAADALEPAYRAMLETWRAHAPRPL